MAILLIASFWYRANNVVNTTVYGSFKDQFDSRVEAKILINVIDIFKSCSFKFVPETVDIDLAISEIAYLSNISLPLAGNISTFTLFPIHDKIHKSAFRNYLLKFS